MRSLTATVPHTNEWSFGAFGHFHHFGNFHGVHFTHAAAVDAEVLGEAVHSASFNGALASDDSVAEGWVHEHLMVNRSVGYEGVEFEERAFIEQRTDAVPCCSTSAHSNALLALESPAQASSLSLASQVFCAMVSVSLHGCPTPSRLLIEALNLAGFRGVPRKGCSAWLR